MRRRWARPVTAIGLAAAVLLAAGAALGPLRSAGDDPRGPALVTGTAGGGTGDLDRFVARTTTHLGRTPRDWQAWAQLGMAQLELARSTSDPAHQTLAENALRRSLQVQPTGNAAAHTGLGALAAARHDFRGALGEARRAVAADPYSADAHGVLTDANVELGRYADATAAVQRMLDLRPDTSSYARASYLFELRGDRTRAVELMQQALDVATSPGDITFARTHLADLAFTAGDLDTATVHVDHALARSPGQPALLAVRAKISAARGDLAAAITDMRAASDTLPTVDHLSSLSDMLTAAGDAAGAARTDELIRVSTRLAGKAPASTDIDLVLFHADRDESVIAVTEGRKLLTTRPSVAVETAYSWALHGAGRDREALIHADRGLRLGSRDARAHYYRGLIQSALGDRAGARADLAEALTINPYFSLRYAPRARAELNRLDGTP